MKNKPLKKSLALFLSLLMVMTSLVYVVPSMALAEIQAIDDNEVKGYVTIDPVIYIHGTHATAEYSYMTFGSIIADGSAAGELHTNVSVNGKTLSSITCVDTDKTLSVSSGSVWDSKTNTFSTENVLTGDLGGGYGSNTMDTKDSSATLKFTFDDGTYELRTLYVKTNPVAKHALSYAYRFNNVGNRKRRYVAYEVMAWGSYGYNDGGDQNTRKSYVTGGTETSKISNKGSGAINYPHMYVPYSDKYKAGDMSLPDLLTDANTLKIAGYYAMAKGNGDYPEWNVLPNGNANYYLDLSDPDSSVGVINNGNDNYSIKMFVGSIYVKNDDGEDKAKPITADKTGEYQSPCLVSNPNGMTCVSDSSITGTVKENDAVGYSGYSTISFNATTAGDYTGRYYTSYKHATDPYVIANVLMNYSIRVVDKSKVRKLYNDCVKVANSAVPYTADSWNKYSSALRSAEYYLNNYEVSTAEEETYYNGLKTAYDALEKKTFTVNYYDENGTTLLKSEEVKYGETAKEAPTPTKASTETYHYTFSKWTYIDNDSAFDVANRVITADVNLKAAYAGGKHDTITKQENVINATCDSAGSYTEVKYCSVCNYEHSRTDGITIKANGHNWVEDAAPSFNLSYATCTAPAVYYKSCSTCGKSAKGIDETQTFTYGDPLGHDMTKTDKKDATCTADGTNAYWTCSVCKNVYADEDGKTVTTVEDMKISAKGHNFTNETATDAYLKSEATCTKQAVYYKSCSACGVTSSGTTSEATFSAGALKDHDFSVMRVEPKYLVSNATCEGKAVYYYACNACGESSKGYTNTTFENGNANGHKLVETERVEATCLKAGNIEYWACSVCGKIFSDYGMSKELTEEDTVIAKLNHSYTGASKKDSDGENGTHSYKCVNGCGEYGNPTAHSWDDGNETKAPNCTDKGVTTFTCNDCGATYTADIPANGHSMTKTDKKDATCTADGTNAYWTCSVCKNVYADVDGKTATTVGDMKIPAKGHTYGDWIEGTLATCVNTGMKGHYTCSVCEKNFDTNKNEIINLTIDINSNYHANTVDKPQEDATCTEVGYTVGTYCNDCKNWTKGHDEIPALDHDYSGKPVLTRPTQEDGEWINGYYTYTCKNDESHTKTEAANRANYAEYDVALEKLKSLLDNDITEEAKNGINNLISNTIAQDLIESEQKTVDNETAKLNKAFADYSSALKTYTVEFVVNGVTVKTEPVVSGNYATAPAAENYYDETNHYTFSKWDKDFSNVTEDMTVTAVFTSEEHSFTYDDKTDNVHTVSCYCGYSADVAHSYNDGEVTTEATCETVGEKTYTCSLCDGTKTEEIDALGHDTSKVDAKDATCTEDGNKEYYTCSRCDKLFEDKDAKTETTLDEVTIKAAHSWEDDFTIDKEATCEEAGSKSIHCSKCEEKKTVTTIDALGHKFTNETVDEKYLASAATCTAKATYYKSCSVCEKSSNGLVGEETFEAGEMLPHEFTVEVEGTKTAATCKDEGSVTMKCAKCDETTIKTLEIDLNNHQGETETRDQKTANCHENGYTGDKYCLDCGARIETGTETDIDKNNHDGETEVRDTVAATCKTEGYSGDTYCLGCNNKIEDGQPTEIDPSNHETTETYLKDNKAATCTSEGYTGDTHYECCDALKSKGETIPMLDHTWDNKVDDEYLASAATCVAKATYYQSCSVCDAKGTVTFENGEKLDHSYTGDAQPTGFGHHLFKCVNGCGQFGGEEECHGGTAVCGSQAKCEICDASYGEVKAHNYGEWAKNENGGHTKTCSDCDAETKGHSVSEPHNWDKGVITTPATCGAEGVKTFTCGDCGATKTEPTGTKDPNNHVGETVIKDAKKATCKTIGYTGDVYCKGCTKKISSGTTINVDPNNHAWGEWGTDKEATCIEEGVSKRVCKECGIDETQPIEKNPNNHVDITVGVDRKDPTCTEPGYVGATVCACGHVVEQGTYLEALGHEQGAYEIKVMPTEDGVKGKAVSICTRCGIVLGEKEIAYGDIHFVAFYDYNGVRLIKPRYYIYGDKVIRPANNPVRPDDDKNTYKFIGWNYSENELNCVTKEMAVIAQYEAIEKSYTVTFFDADGNPITVPSSSPILYSDIVKSYTGETPTKAEDSEYTYTFSGWAISCDQSTGEASVYPQFTATAKVNEDEEPNEGIFGWLIRLIRKILAWFKGE